MQLQFEKLQLYRLRGEKTEKEYFEQLDIFKICIPWFGQITFDNLWNAMCFDENAFELLLEKAKDQGFNLNQKNKDGKTLIFLAVGLHCLSCCKLLLKEKADPNIKSDEGLNAFDAAQKELKLMEKHKHPHYETCLKVTQLLEQVKS